jgi:uncharacterized protein YcfL
MKKLVLCLLILLLLIGCTSNETKASPESDIIKSLEIEMMTLVENQNTLTEEIDMLSEQVKSLESILSKKEKEIETINMDLLSLNRVDNLQDELFSSMISEAVRLYGYGELEEKLYLIEDFDYENNIVTVRDKHNELTEYNVSEACKVLVAGQYYTIYQDLEEGRDFIDSTKGDPVHKVIIVLKDGIVEQIQMYGGGS